MPPVTESPTRGLYGVRVGGLGECTSMGPVPASWPAWSVDANLSAETDSVRPEAVGHDLAFIRFGDGSTVEATRLDSGGRVRLQVTADAPLCELVHPYLAAVGMLTAYWGDRLAIHAGAFGADGRAWLIVGTKGGGKSTTLATLDLAGYSVLADDMAVIDHDLTVHRGPRMIDLRPDAAAVLGVGEDIGVLGVRERWRYRIENGPLTLSLGGIVVPVWGDPAVELVRGSERLALLAPHLALRVPAPWDELFMDVALSVPVYRWSRPPGLEDAQNAIDQLLDVARR